MRDLEDARRSVARYLMHAFPDYDIFIHRAEQEFDRPGIVIRTPGGLQAIAGGGWAMVDVLQPFAVYVYPRFLDEVKPSETHMHEERSKLFAALVHGLRLEDGTRLGARDRLPLWDYAGVPYDQPLPQERAPVVEYMRMAGLEITPTQETDDDRMWTILANFRLTWRQAAFEYHGPLVTEPPRFARVVG